jgi:hypothetical protein
MRIWPAFSWPKVQPVPATQPLFVVGLQFSEQRVTFGMGLPFASLMPTAQRPPGATQSLSVLQNSLHRDVLPPVFRQTPPGAQSPGVQIPPGWTLPEGWHECAPVPSIVQPSPAAQPHCGARPQGVSHGPPPLLLELPGPVVLLL